MISIILPIKNGVEYLDECIRSIKEQTFTMWELHIGINGIDDKEKELEIRQKVNEQISVCKLNTIGKPATLNQLLNYCNYDWIALIDVDDKWEKTKLEKQWEYRKKYDVIGTGCKYFGDKNHHPDIPYDELDINQFKVNPVINSSVLMKKKLAHWNEDFPILEDYELWLRLINQGYKFFNINETLIYHRIHKDSFFNTQKEKEKIYLEKLNKIYYN
ncbi:MAG: glycosyltransferase family 2 protein [Candidatus Thorarchaeota archaeon]